MKKYMTRTLLAALFAQVLFVGFATTQNPQDNDTYLACSCGKKH